MARTYDEAVAISAELTELRRSIHAEPEIGLDLPRTQRKVLDALAGLPLEISLGREPELGHRGAARCQARQDRAAARRHGRAARSPSGPACRTRRRSPGPCTHAGTTCTRRCWPARPNCCQPARTSWPATSSSCSSRARRAPAAPASWWPRACWTRPASRPVGRLRPPCRVRSTAAAASSPAGPARSWPRRTPCTSPCMDAAATARNRIARPTRCRLLARSCWRCRRW